MLADNEKYSTRDLTEPSSVDPAGYTDPQPPQAEESFEFRVSGVRFARNASMRTDLRAKLNISNTRLQSLHHLHYLRLTPQW